jgi:ATPase subunit of ABC transporter with duplicated ATPase domains
MRLVLALAIYTGAVLAFVHDRDFVEQFAMEMQVMEVGRIRQSTNSQL